MSTDMAAIFPSINTVRGIFFSTADEPPPPFDSDLPASFCPNFGNPYFKGVKSI